MPFIGEFDIYICFPHKFQLHYTKDPSIANLNMYYVGQCLWLDSFTLSLIDDFTYFFPLIISFYRCCCCRCHVNVFVICICFANAYSNRIWFYGVKHTEVAHHYFALSYNKNTYLISHWDGIYCYGFVWFYILSRWKIQLNVLFSGFLFCSQVCFPMNK